MSRGKCRGIGLSQAYKIQGNGTFAEYMHLNGASGGRVKAVRHRLSRGIGEAAMKQLKRKGISNYGCIHLRLGDFADYCKLKPVTWTHPSEPRSRTNQSSDTSSDDCFVSYATVEKCVSSFSNGTKWIAFISNDKTTARSMVELAINQTKRRISVFSPEEVVTDRYPEFGTVDRFVCSYANEAILNQYSTFSQDIAWRMRRSSRLMYIGDWKWRRP